MVRALHAEGIEVILDVVYNHTVEGEGGVLFGLPVHCLLSTCPEAALPRPWSCCTTS